MSNSSKSRILFYDHKPLNIRPNNFSIDKDRVRQPSRETIISISKYDQLCKKPRVMVAHNIFLKNYGISLILDHSIDCSNVKIIDNLFDTNLLNIICNIEKNKENTRIQGNVFKVVVTEDEKTIKFAKTFRGLEFIDNHFVKKKKNNKYNIWERLFGFSNSTDDVSEEKNKKLKNLLRGPMVDQNWVLKTAM